MASLRTILKSKFSNKEHLGDWYKERLKICAACPHNSYNIPIVDFNWRMWKWHFLNLFKPFCGICGCQITAKASLEIEECSLEEIGEEPKWVSVL